EIEELHRHGVARIYSPEDGAKLGLQGMIEDMIRTATRDLSSELPAQLEPLYDGETRTLARVITALENSILPESMHRDILKRAASRERVPVLGITGTGGSGKSSLTDELILRLRHDQAEKLRIAVVAIDPSRRKSGGALLGDRIRMNAITHPNVYMRSLATREAASEIAACLPDVIAACKAGGFDVVIIETSGIGQGDAAIVPHVDYSLYVMTPEFGAASQLEKIDMLDFADFVAINKFDRRGAQDALRDVRKQMQRNRQAFSTVAEDMPVFGTIASKFNDDGVTALYQAIAKKLAERGLPAKDGRLNPVQVKYSSSTNVIVPPARVRYLAEIADTVRGYYKRVKQQSTIARERQQLRETKRMLEAAKKSAVDLDALVDERDKALCDDARALLAGWPALRQTYSGAEHAVNVRDNEIRTKLFHTTLSGTRIPKVALPKYEDDGELLAWLMKENVPGSFPYTAGVFALKRENEDPTRMFAGEGDPFRTNARFKFLSRDYPAKRLSTAFDSVTLYG
ncbi:MAG: GTP-binding protein, partial [Burkholderiales bacterium]